MTKATPTEKKHVKTELPAQAPAAEDVSSTEDAKQPETSVSPRPTHIPAQARRYLHQEPVSDTPAADPAKPAGGHGIITLGTNDDVLHPAPARQQHASSEDDEGTVDLNEDDVFTAPYKIGPMIARGAESVLYTSSDSENPICIKSIRNNLSKVIGPMSSKNNEGKVKVPYRSKVRHLKNECRIGRELQAQETGRLPVVRIHGLRKVRRLGFEIGYDLLMDYVDGTDLSDKQALKAFTVAQKIDFFYQTTKALDFMHRKHYVHLDMKPSNIMVAKGVVTLIDFGVSVSVGTKPRAVTGTAGYLSPEQIVRDYLDERTDIFALGVTFGVVFGGHPLRQDGDKLKSKLLKREARFHMDSLADPMVTDFPEIMHMKSLRELLARCTISQRDKRINSASTILNSLVRIAKRHDIPLSN
ncbi:MAG: protein kinase [Lentisphaeria bacterium]|nr:protein kinase [Lentisphaeria bacterium]